MPVTIRLNDDEQRLLSKRTRAINKQLVKRGDVPLRESEVVHLILNQALKDALEEEEDGDCVVKSSPIVETKVQYY